MLDLQEYKKLNIFTQTIRIILGSLVLIFCLFSNFVFAATPLTAFPSGLTATAVEYSAKSSKWKTRGTEMYVSNSNEWLEYYVDFGSGSSWIFSMTATNKNSVSSPGLPSGYSFEIRVAVDGTTQGYLYIPGSTTTYKTGSLAPFTLSGVHTIRFTWVNDAYKSGVYDANIRVKEVSFMPHVFNKIPLEAESGAITSPFQAYDDINASSGKYVLVPSGAGSNTTPPGGPGVVSFSFNVPQADTYQVWARVIAPSNSDDSFFVQIDSGSVQLWDTPQGTDWQWGRVADRTNGTFNANLSSGTHTLYFRQREDGTSLDKIIIINDTNYVPGPEDVLPPEETDTTPPTGTITINNNDEYTNSTSVTLTLSAEDNPGGSGLSQMQFSNDNSNWSTPEAYATTKAWDLTSGDGTKTVYAKFKDVADNWSSVVSDTIILETAPVITPVVNDEGDFTSNNNQLYAFWTTDGLEVIEYQYKIIRDSTTGTVIKDWTSTGTDNSVIADGLNLEDGKVYYFGVQAKNAGGVWSETGYSDGITIDTIAPVTTISEIPEDWSSESITISLTAIDSGSGVKETRYSTDGSEPGIQYTSSFILDDGIYTLKYYSEDNIGNREFTQTAPNQARIDTIQPTGSITINSGAESTDSTSVTLTLSATDSGSGVSQMQFSNDNSNWFTPETYATTKAWDLTSGDGTKTVYAKFSDVAGNWSSSVSDTIVLDTQQSIPLTAFPSGLTATAIEYSAKSSKWKTRGTEMYVSNSNEWLEYYVDFGSGSSWIFSMTATNKNSASSPGLPSGYSFEIRVAVDGTTQGYLYIPGSTTTYKTGSLTPLTLSGIHTVRFTWTNDAYKSGVYDANIRVKEVAFMPEGSDTTPPTGTITINNNDEYTNSTSVTLTLSATDSGSDVSQMQFSNDNSTWSTPETYATTRTWDLTSGDGTKTVYAKFSDVAGNWSEAVSDSIILDTQEPVDTTPPSGIITINNGNQYTNSSTVTLTLSATDSESGMGSGAQMQFSNDNSNWSTPEAYSVTKTWTLTAEDDIKTVYAKFSDVAGNWSSVVSDTITLDTTAPIIVIISPTDGAVIDTPDIIVQYTVDGANKTKSVVLTEGLNTITIEEIDEAGNTGSASITVTLDTSPITDSIIIDNGDTGTSSTGSWNVSSGVNPYGSGSIYAWDTATYSWHTNLPQSGSYEVYMWWTEYDNRSTNAPITITYNGGSQTVNVNQQTDGGKWNLLGTYTFDTVAGGTVRLDVPKATATYTTYCADAVKFVYVQGASTRKIPLEAESGAITSPFQAYDDINASSGKYVLVPSGAGSNTTPPGGPGVVSFSFNVPQADTYQVWARVIAPSNSDDSFFVQIDEGDIQLWDTPQGTDWQWGRVADRTNGTFNANLSSGTHTLYFRQREDGTSLDKIIIINDTNYVPGPEDVSPPEETDTTPPTGTITINNNDEYTNSTSVTLTLSAEDNPGGSGLSQMQFSNDNSTWPTPETYATTKAWDLTSGDGTKTVYVKFSDVAGNWSSAVSDTIVLDTQQTTLLTAFPSGLTATAIQTSSISSEWTTSGTERYTYSSNNWLEYYVDFGSDGSWIFSMTATNEINTSSPDLPSGYNFNIAVTVDGVSEGSFNVPGSTTTYETGSLTPLTLSGIHTIRFTWTNDAYQSGSYDANIRVKDVSFMPEVSDTTPPTGTITINSGAQSTDSTSVTLTLSATDSGSGVSQMQFSNDNSNWSTPETYATTKAWDLTSGDGTKTVYARFSDVAGNWSDAVSDTIILNTTVPEITSITPVEHSTFYENETISITPTVNDADSPTLEYQFSIDGVIKQTWSSESTYIWMTTFGKHSIKVEVRDIGGQDNKEIEIYVFRKPIEHP